MMAIELLNLRALESLYEWNIEKLTAERDEARAWARRMKLERDEALEELESARANIAEMREAIFGGNEARARQVLE